MEQFLKPQNVVTRWQDLKLTQLWREFLKGGNFSHSNCCRHNGGVTATEFGILNNFLPGAPPIENFIQEIVKP